MNNSNLLTHMIDFEQLPDCTSTIILGGGLNGLELASDLYYLGVEDVIIIELGKLLDSKHIYFTLGAEEATRLWLNPATDKSFWRPWSSETPPNYAAWGGLRRRLGGRSLYWNGVCLRIEPWALFDPQWPENIVKDLVISWNGERSLYSILEEEIALWRKLPLEIGLGNPYGFSAEIFHELGYANASMVLGMVRHHITENGKVRFSAYTPLELWDGSDDCVKLPLIVCELEVINVIVNENKAIGVRLRDRRTNNYRVVKANKIILATGTIENSRLAIQAFSAIGANNSLSLSGLTDHIVQGFTARIPNKDLSSDMLAKVQPGPLFMIGGNSDSRSSIFAQFSYDHNMDLIFDVWAMGEQLPNANNVVRCESTTEPPWRTIVRAGMSSDDLKIVEKQKIHLWDLWNKFCVKLNHKPNDIKFVDFLHSGKNTPGCINR